ncbi:hypothetical protein MTR67_036433 [Solanum verrucosum]|uniref:Uncharacterized protein n=1 Tax=Solanum verrucosum TaxID=315347 RepID=A0AAF0UC13_SOLVR|nr:hypothetical protein MTR67_036433 [Solanum verrucosum]
MQIFRSCRCNLQSPPTDRSLIYGPCCGSVVHYCSPSQKPSSENQLSLDPLIDPRSVGQTTVRRSRPPQPLM